VPKGGGPQWGGTPWGGISLECQGARGTGPCTTPPPPKAGVAWKLNLKKINLSRLKKTMWEVNQKDDEVKNKKAKCYSKIGTLTPCRLRYLTLKGVLRHVSVFMYSSIRGVPTSSGGTHESSPG